MGRVKVDHDELPLLAKKKGLVFLRNGAVDTRYLAMIIRDVDREKEVLRRQDETDEEHQARINNEVSEDVFAGVRDDIRKALEDNNSQYPQLVPSLSK